MQKTAFVIVIASGLLVVGVWLTAVFEIVSWIRMADLPPLFMGLGFVAIATVLLQERKAAAIARAEHEELVRALLEQTRKIGALVNASARNSRVASIAAELVLRESHFEHESVAAGGADEPNRRRELLSELAKSA